MRVSIGEIVDHPAVTYDHSTSSSTETLGDNEALDALRQLRLRRESAKQNFSPGGWLHSFADLPRGSDEWDMLLTAYGLRTACLPPDLSCFVQSFVEQDHYDGRRRLPTDPTYVASEPNVPFDPGDYDFPWFMRAIDDPKRASLRSLHRGSLSLSKPRSRNDPS